MVTGRETTGSGEDVVVLSQIKRSLACVEWPTLQSVTKRLPNVNDASKEVINWLPRHLNVKETRAEEMYGSKTKK